MTALQRAAARALRAAGHPAGGIALMLGLRLHYSEVLAAVEVEP